MRKTASHLFAVLSLVLAGIALGTVPLLVNRFSAEDEAGPNTPPETAAEVLSIQ